MLCSHFKVNKCPIVDPKTITKAKPLKWSKVKEGISELLFEVVCMESSLKNIH